MNRFKQVLTMLVVAIFVAATAIPADARSSGSSSSRSSFSSSSRSSSSSVSKPSGNYSPKPASSVSKPSGSSSGSSVSKPASSVSKPSGSSSGSSVSKPSGTNYTKPRDFFSRNGGGSFANPKANPTSFDQKIAQKNRKAESAKALESYRASTNQFKAKPAAYTYGADKKRDTVYRTTTVRYRYDPVSYDTRRTAYYRGWSTPTYAYGFSPYYGPWDTMFMFYLLSHSGHDDEWFYHHRHDPDVQRYLNSAANDANTKAQVASLNARMAALEKQGMREDPNYVAKAGDVALAAAVVDQAYAPVFRIATGSPKGNYYYFASLIKQKLGGKVEVEVIPTQGSMENLDLLASGKVDAIVAQSDAFGVYKKEHPSSSISSEQGVLYKEFVQVLANRKSGVKSVKDLDSKHTLYIGGERSGSAVTWRNFCIEDSSYSKIKVVYEQSVGQALQKAASDPNGVMLFVSGLKSDILTDANKLGDRLCLVKVDDGDFNDAEDEFGNQVYEFKDVPGDTYKNLQDGVFFTSVETISLDAVFVMSSQWAGSNPDLIDAVASSVIDSTNDVKQRVGSL